MLALYSSECPDTIAWGAIGLLCLYVKHAGVSVGRVLEQGGGRQEGTEGGVGVEV